jgi:hypothetical protein
LSVDIRDHGDWVGTVEVGHNEGWFFWKVRNGKGTLLQDDHEKRDVMSLRVELAIVLKFLLATADRPLIVFYDSVTVWALLNRKAIKKTLDEL